MTRDSDTRPQDGDAQTGSAREWRGPEGHRPEPVVATIPKDEPDVLLPCFTCRERTWCEITHTSNPHPDKLYRCANCKAIYPAGAITNTRSSTPVGEVAGLVDRESALAKALCLLDTFAGEGFAHTYGNGQTLDAADVCAELTAAFGVPCEPGWWRTIAGEHPTPVDRDIEGLVERLSVVAWRDMLKTGLANDLRDWSERTARDGDWKTYSPALPEATKAKVRSAVRRILTALSPAPVQGDRGELIERLIEDIIALPGVAEGPTPFQVHDLRRLLTDALTADAALIAHQPDELIRLRNFTAAIHAATPNGEWIAVQHHPDGDWSVAVAPITAAEVAKDALIASLQERVDAADRIVSALSNTTIPPGCALWDALCAYADLPVAKEQG